MILVMKSYDKIEEKDCREGNFSAYIFRFEKS